MFFSLGKREADMTERYSKHLISRVSFCHLERLYMVEEILLKTKCVAAFANCYIFFIWYNWLAQQFPRRVFIPYLSFVMHRWSSYASLITLDTAMNHFNSGQFKIRMKEMDAQVNFYLYLNAVLSPELFSAWQSAHVSPIKVLLGLA